MWTFDPFFFILVPVELSVATTLGRRLQGAAVEEGRGGLGLPLIHQTQDLPQVVGDLLEHVGGQPVSRLLGHRRPRREVVGQEASLAPGLDHVPPGSKTSRSEYCRCGASSRIRDR